MTTLLLDPTTRFVLADMAARAELSGNLDQLEAVKKMFIELALAKLNENKPVEPLKGDE